MSLYFWCYLEPFGHKSPKRKKKRNHEFKLKLITYLVGLVVAIAVLLLIDPFVPVGAGERAVITRNGAVDKVDGPGLNLIPPIFYSAVKFNVQTQKEQTDATAASSDLQTVTTTVAINYNVNPAEVADLYARKETEYKSTIVDPAIQEAVKAATANFSAEQLITDRPDVTEAIKSNLVAALTPYDLQVTSVDIVNFAFSDSFNTAIEAKVTAQQIYTLYRDVRA